MRGLEKKLAEAEGVIAKMKESASKEGERYDKERNKMMKKIEQSDGEMKRVEGERRKLEKSLSECLR